MSEKKTLPGFSLFRNGNNTITKKYNKRSNIIRKQSIINDYVIMCVTNHHLAGGVLRQTAHHGVHLVELLEGGLHLRVQLLVLCVLVVKHGPVLVPLLV